MACYLSDLGKSLVERLMNWTIEESRNLFCFTCIVKEFEDEQEALKANSLTLVERVKVAKNQGNRSRPDVTLWQEKAAKLINEDTKTNMKCFFGLCPNCIWRYSRGKELADKTKEIGRLMQRNFDSVGLPPNLPGVEYHSSWNYISFKSRESKCKELLDVLKDDSAYLIGLQGMGGTGKTTLAKQVGKELKQSQHFDLIVDTTVSDPPDIKKIQDDLAAPLGLDLKNNTESERPKILWSRLTNGDKILVILDDVWGPINLEAIGIPYRDDCKSCKLLVTTRNLSVCNSLGCEWTIQLELLSMEDAWILFKKHADISDGFSKRLLDKGHMIVKECKGLPVAIAAIASSLKGQKGQEEWNEALLSLQNSMHVHGVDENLIEVYKCLRYSFDNLKNERAMKLFLLCSLFPEDKEIPTETLTNFGKAVGLFGKVDGKYDEARSQVVVAKNKLIDSCLLLEAEGENVKMHDLVREVALWIANKEIQGVNLSDKIQKSRVEKEKDIKYLFCEGDSKDLSTFKFDSSKLEILICYIKGPRSYIIPNTLFENMARLRALHLLGNKSYFGFVTSILSLPQSIQYLTNVRSLVLQNLSLGDVSILGKLPSLETLDLICSSIDELPHQIRELVNFRILKLENCKIKRKGVYEVIERCSSLEELYIICEPSWAFILDGTHDEYNITLPSLQRYHLSQECNHNKKYSASKCVCLPNIDVLFSKATFKRVMQTTEILHLKGIEGAWRNLIPEIIPIEHGMSELVDLSLKSSSRIQCLVDTSNISSHIPFVFPELVALTLNEMENLVALWNGPLPSDFLTNLESLDISQCARLQGLLFKSKLNLCNLRTLKLSKCSTLVSLFQLSTCQSLVLLEELVIVDCEELTSIITNEGQGEEIVDGDNEDSKSHGLMFPKLKILEIRGSPRLDFIIPSFSAQDIPLLEVIKIYECGELKYIFGQYQHEHGNQGMHHELKDLVLGSVKQMELHGLPNFIDIFPECNHPMCLSVMTLSSKDDSKEQVHLKPTKCSIFPWSRICCYGDKSKQKLKSTASTKVPAVSKDQLHDYTVSLASKNSGYVQFLERAKCLSKQMQIWCKIKKMELCNLPKLTTVFVLSIVPTMLLETLRVEKCDELKHIIIDIGNGPDNNKGSIVFPKLTEVSVKGCRQLEYIFGSYPDDHQICDEEIYLHLPALENFELFDLPNLMGICPEHHHTMLPSLRKLQVNGCSHFTIKSIGDFIIHWFARKQSNSTTVKDLNGNTGNVKHFHTLETLEIYNSNAGTILCLDEKIGEQINLGIQNIQLGDQVEMTDIFKGPENSFFLENLRTLIIERCDKLEVIFSASTVRCLHQLQKLMIVECKELKQIVKEEDLENQKMSNLLSQKTCFPKLTTLVVEKCNKLKCVIPMSTPRELQMLEVLMIKEANELEEVFRCKHGDQKIELPNLKVVVLAKLPSLSQGIELQTVKHHLVLYCPKLASTLRLSPAEIMMQSTGKEINLDEIFQKVLRQNPSVENIGAKISSFVTMHIMPPEMLKGILKKKKKDNSEGSIFSFLNITSEHAIAKDVVRDGESQVTSGIVVAHTETIVPESEGEKISKIQDASSNENLDSETTRGFPIVPEVHGTLGSELTSSMGVKRNVGEGTTSTIAKTITPITHSESVSLSADLLVSCEHKTNPKEDVDASHSHETSVVAIAETYASGSIVKEQLSKDDNKGVPESIKSSPTTPSISSQSLSAPLEISKHSELNRGSSPSPLVIPLHKSKTHSHELLDEPSKGEPCLTNKQQPLGETDIATENPQGIKEIGDGQIAIPSFPVKAAENPTSEDVDVSHSQETLAETHAPGNPSQVMEDSSFASLVTKELEQLVSNRHLAYENMPLLTDFLIKHPSVRLTNDSFSNRHKGYAYNCLAELLKFLQTHSVLDALGSNHSEFVELLQDVRRFAFDKDWLDNVERRALFPGLQVSQDALRKLLDSKHSLAKHLEDLRQQLVESINEQEAQVLEAKTALSAPLGY